MNPRDEICLEDWILRKLNTDKSPTNLAIAYWQEISNEGDFPKKISEQLNRLVAKKLIEKHSAERYSITEEGKEALKVGGFEQWSSISNLASVTLRTYKAKWKPEDTIFIVRALIVGILLALFTYLGKLITCF